ncbi:barbed-end actin filament uncapping, partial [Bonamia ostreae]
LSIDGENLKVIGETIRNLENSYRKILVENVQISDNAFSDFSYDILCNKNVEKVKMFDCKVNSPNCMNGFYAGFQKYHPNLKSLNISNNNKIGDIGIENLARVIGNCSLESFKFSHCGFTAKGMNILSIALCSKFLLKSIKKLDLSNNNLKKEGSFYLARFIKRTKTLEKLNLSNTEICVGTIVNAIVNRKVSKKSLTDIDLSNCLKMDEADKKALGFYLKNTTTLSRCQMSGIKNNPR